jgi:hypothetical protein
MWRKKWCCEKRRRWEEAVRIEQTATICAGTLNQQREEEATQSAAVDVVRS